MGVASVCVLCPSLIARPTDSENIKERAAQLFSRSMKRWFVCHSILAREAVWAGATKSLDVAIRRQHTHTQRQTQHSTKLEPTHKDKVKCIKAKLLIVRHWRAMCVCRCACCCIAQLTSLVQWIDSCPEQHHKEPTASQQQQEERGTWILQHCWNRE